MKVMRWLLILLFVLFSSSQGFAWDYKEDPRIKESFGEIATEAVYYPTDNSNFKRTGLGRFGFWFDLPMSWKAISASFNGDGYRLLTNQRQEIDLRFYGGYNVFGPDAEDYYELYTSRGAQINDFQFRDGEWGKHIEQNEEHYFIRVQDGVAATFYVNAPPEWIGENQELVHYMAASLRWGYSDEDGIPMYGFDFQYCPSCRMVQPILGPFGQVEHVLGELMPAIAEGYYWEISTRLHPAVVTQYEDEGQDVDAVIRDLIRSFSEQTGLVWEIDSIALDDFKTEAVGVIIYGYQGHLRFRELTLILEKYGHNWCVKEILF